MNLGEILREGFRLIRLNIVSLLLFLLCTHISLNLVRTLLAGTVTAEKYGETTFSLTVLGIRWIEVFLTFIVLIGVPYIVEGLLQGQVVSLGNVFRFSFSRFWDVFWTSLFLGLITLGLTLLLVVPGIIWSNYYSFAIIIAALRGTRTKTAFEYSKKLIQGQWWRIFGIYTAICIPAAVFNLSILALSRKVPDIKFLSIFAPLTIFNIIGVLTSVMVVVLFLNTEYVRDFQRQNRGKTNRT
ncbi:hypothetical protein ANAEL_01319 [Anaerolineales bacterium]|nr:hypothetical protein ANAEL_01319 [Anaerolineales bacterium]